MFSVKVDVSECNRALAAMMKEFDKAATDTVTYGAGVAEDVARAAIRAQTKRRTGQLEKMTGKGTMLASIGKTAFLYSTMDYASYIEEGTYTHFIPSSPKPKGKWLRFEQNGQEVFRKQVRHPGNKAMPFMKPAAIAAEGAMVTFLTQRAHEITNK